MCTIVKLPAKKLTKRKKTVCVPLKTALKKWPLLTVATKMRLKEYFF